MPSWSGSSPLLHQPLISLLHTWGSPQQVTLLSILHASVPIVLSSCKSTLPPFYSSLLTSPHPSRFSPAIASSQTPQTKLDASGFPSHLVLIVSLLICWRARAVSCISDIFVSAWRKSSRRVCEMNGWMNEVDIVLYFLTWGRSEWVRLIIHSWELWTMVEQKCCPHEKTLVGLILGCWSKARLLTSWTTLKAQCWGVLPFKYTEGRLGP